MSGQGGVDPAGIAARLQGVQAAIAEACREAVRPPGAARLVAVTKGHPASAVAAAAAAGQQVFGENYAREMREKRADLGTLADSLEWHFIGRVQASNAKDIVRAALVHGVGSRGQAEALAARASQPLAVLLQVSLWGEQSKNGFEAEELERELPALREIGNLSIRGLMAMPPPSAHSRAAFAAVRALRDRLAPDPSALPELSMGMSGDFREAILEGATLVRVGTAIFGERSKKAG